MAVGMFLLSQKMRNNLAVFFIILCVIQIIIGCGMTGSSLYVIIAVAPILHAEKTEVNFVFVVTGIYGTHVIFHWIIGVNISQRCLKQASRRSTSNLFILWTCMGTNTILQLIILSHFAKKMNRYISRSIKQSITNGMNQYLQDITWKETIDKLQYTSECCGLTSYEDWHEVKWLTKYHVDVNSQTIKELKTNGVLTLPVTPWSCCKIDFPMQCLHDPIQQTEYTHIWLNEPTVITDSINTKGCLDILRKPIDWVIKTFVASSSVLFIIHVVIFIISRIIYTSARNAILLGNPEGTAPGWVFGRGDCGYSGGKSVVEIMRAHQVFSTDVNNTEDEIETKKQTKGYKAFFKSKMDSFKSKKVEESDENEESIPLIETTDEKKLEFEKVEIKNINEKSKSPIAPIRSKNKSKGTSKMDSFKSKKVEESDENEESIPLIETTNEKKLETGKLGFEIEQVEIKNINEKSKSPIASIRTKKKSKGTSSGEETVSNSIAEEIKRLQQ